MADPFDLDELAQKTREMPFGCDVPGNEEQNEDRDIGPMEKARETQSRFAIQRRQQNKNRERINQSKQGLGQTGERAADPKTKKPPTASAPPLVTAQPAKHRARYKRAEQRFRHQDPSEHRGPAAAKINQARKKSAPIICQLLRG